MLIDLEVIMPMLIEFIKFCSTCGFIYAVAEKGVNMMCSYVRGDNNARW